MKTHFESIYFTESYTHLDKSEYFCINNKSNSSIGRITYCSVEKQHVYIPNTNTQYSSLCLSEISIFVTYLNNQ